MSDEKPRTHRWIRREGSTVRRRPASEQVISTDIPSGDAPDDEQLSEQVRAALKGWPVVVLRVVAQTEGRTQLGRHPGRWVRTQLGRVIDQRLWTSPGPRATRPNCGAYRLLGRHARGQKPDGEAWAPLTVRPAGLPEGTLDEGGRLRFELAIAGKDAVATLPAFVDALQEPLAPMGPDPAMRFTTVQALTVDDDGDLRWRNTAGLDAVPTLPLDRLNEPRVRPGRLVLAFQTATPMQRRGEQGRPAPDCAFVVDRMTRSFGAWMGRTGHRGPRLPVDDLLRAAADAELITNTSRVIEVPQSLLSAEGARGEEERAAALVGELSWRGHFAGMAPLLRAAHWVGMGPGRQHGLGQVAIG